MNRRVLLWIGVAALAVFGSIGLWGLFGTHSVSFMEGEIQQRLNAKLETNIPVKGVAGLVLRSIRVNDSTVRFRDDAVSIAITVTGTLRSGKKVSLTADAVGVPAFDGNAFYFKPREINIRSLSSDDGAADSVKAWVDRHPWVAPLVQDAAVNYLMTRPVYHLKNDVKGRLIGASLESVKIEGNVLKVTFGLLQLGLTVLLGMGCLIAAVGLLLALIRDPSLGAVVLAAAVIGS